MKECRFLRESLVDFVERKLDPESMALLTRHIESCDRCRELARDFGLIWLSADRIEEIDPSADFWSKLQPGLDSADKRLDKRPLLARILPVLRPAAVFTVLLITILLGYGVGNIPVPGSAVESSETAEFWEEYHLESFELFPEGSVADLYFDLFGNGGGES